MAFRYRTQITNTTPLLYVLVRLLINHRPRLWLVLNIESAPVLFLEQHHLFMAPWHVPLGCDIDMRCDDVRMRYGPNP